MIKNKLIRLQKSCISEKEKKAVRKVLDNEFLGMGEEVKLFENCLTKLFGRQTVCVVNGTAALHLALQSIEISSGDEVLVPSLTYVASFQAISATGAKPIACDVDENTFMIDINDAEKKLTDKTKVIMPVHYTGGVGDLDLVYNFAIKNNLRVVEDAAHAFGTYYNNKIIGGFGDIACFSFDGIKNITSGEGGCVVSNDNSVIKKIKDARLLGVEKDTEKRFNNSRSWNFQVRNQGWRYHMSNIMAAIGLEQLKRFDELKLKRRNLAKLYDELFSDVKNINPLIRDYENVVPHIYVIRIHKMKDRQLIIKKMLEKNIQVGFHYQPNHLLEFYKDTSILPITESIFPELLSLPLHPELTKLDVKYISDSLISTLRNYD